MSQADLYADLYFTREQLFLSADEASDVALDILGGSLLPPAHVTDKDRAFVQRALLIAVDASEKAGLLFDLYQSAISANVKKSVQSLVRGLAKKTARRWFNKYIDDTPKISAVGKTATRYSGMGSEWRTRVGVGDDSMIASYLIA